RNDDPALIVALASGSTVQDAAATAGVSVATAHRRLADKGFQHCVTEARDELVSLTVGRLAKATSRAVDTLDALLGDQTPPAVRLGAARAVLEMAAKYREAEELTERVAALEDNRLARTL